MVSRHPDDDTLRTAREDCGMAWLREMRVQGEKETFSEHVAKVQPVLAQGLARSRGARRADLQAHLGWGDFLRSRDGHGAVEPIPQYRAALQDDPDNVYAHAMWAHHIAWRSDRLDDVADRFALALRSPREREWVRGLQFSSAFVRRSFNEYALVVANDMRVQGETVAAGARRTLWSYLFASSFFNPPEREGIFAALAPRDLLDTFDWLYDKPAEQGREEVWRYVRSMLLLNTGDAAGARRDLEKLNRDLVAAKDGSRVATAAREALAQLEGR